MFVSVVTLLLPLVIADQTSVIASERTSSYTYS